MYMLQHAIPLSVAWATYFKNGDERWNRARKYQSSAIFNELVCWIKKLENYHTRIDRGAHHVEPIMDKASGKFMDVWHE